MTLEELQKALDEEKSKTLALQKKLDEASEKIKGIEKENSDYKLENTRLRTINGEILLKLDNARAQDEPKEEVTKSFEESMLEIIEGGN